MVFRSFADGHTEEVATTISEVRVVTFDLDNTIWATSATIDAANAALFDHLTRNNISQPRRVEKVMGEIFEQDRHKYSPMEENETPKSPVFLTKLRVDAIGHILQSYNGYSVEDAERVASEAFQVWTNARHNAIPKNFAGNVIPCLQKIAKIKTSTGHPVLIGAITDGNSDPRNVECLKDFFDFCVNAESVGVAKPDKVRRSLVYICIHLFLLIVFSYIVPAGVFGSHSMRCILPFIPKYGSCSAR